MKIKIEQASAQGFCKKACNFGDTRTGRCRYHDFKSHNYRDIEPGQCALTDEEIETMRKEHSLTPPRNRGKR